MVDYIPMSHLILSVFPGLKAHHQRRRLQFVFGTVERMPVIWSCYTQRRPTHFPSIPLKGIIIFSEKFELAGHGRKTKIDNFSWIV